MQKKHLFNSMKYSEIQMKKLAEELAKRVRIFPEGGNILFLKGEVGAGKTTFTRYFSEYLGAKSGSSPTFTLLEKREISDTVTLFHGDFYRADRERISDIIDEYQDIQAQEISDQKKNNTQKKQYIWILEWFPEKLIPEFFPDEPKIFLNFEHGENQDERDIIYSFDNPLSIEFSGVKRLIERYKTPVHIQHHIEMVRKIAVVVASKLQKNRIPLDRELVENSALLHDCVKYVDFPEYTEQEKHRYQEEITPEKLEIWKRTKQKFFSTDHGKAMAEILTTAPEHFPATARVIESHMTRRIFSDTPMTWEEKCVYYADKRALHDTFVSIHDRLEDGKKRYSHEASPLLEEKIQALERSLETAGKFSGNSLTLT